MRHWSKLYVNSVLFYNGFMDEQHTHPRGEDGVKSRAALVSSSHAFPSQHLTAQRRRLQPFTSFQSPIPSTPPLPLPTLPATLSFGAENVLNAQEHTSRPSLAALRGHPDHKTSQIYHNDDLAPQESAALPVTPAFCIRRL